MGGQVVVAHAWKEWGIQALVLLSLTVQVALLALAEFRRRVRSGTLMFFIWSAYMLADATAIYVLGHMSVTSRSPEHQLVAFWAPFLLLHLGGQDNITAYAIEDNRLWLRHLQALAVQVGAAAYVLYESSIITGAQPLLRQATILMFLIGAVKYGERVCALWLASRSAVGNNYQPFQGPNRFSNKLDFIGDLVSEILSQGKGSKTEAHVLLAHRMLDVPKRLLKGSGSDDQEVYSLLGIRLYKVVEVQLSLMHDVFFTKREIIHSNWYGICVHVMSMAATVTVLKLFNLLIQNDHRKYTVTTYNKVDVAVTYVLLVGAVVLETLSLLMLAFSCWTFSYTKDWDSVCNILVARMVSFVRRLVHAANYRGRYWSASMGQYNLLQLSSRSKASRSSKMARRMGLEDRWNMLAYSWSIPVSAFIEESLVNQLFERRELVKREMRMNRTTVGGEERGEETVLEVNGGPDPQAKEAEELLVWGVSGRPEDQLSESRDRFDERVPAKLKRWGLYTFGLTWSIEERIIVWHIATNIYLTWWYEEHGNNMQEHTKANKAEAYKVEHSKRPNAEAVEALSNYMVFLLAARPDMVSPTGRSIAYVQACYALTVQGPECETAEDLARSLRCCGNEMLNRPEESDVKPGDYGFCTYDIYGRRYSLPLALQIGCKLGANLIRNHADDTLDVIAQVWVETMYHAAQSCSAYAHAKQLNNGGELITIAAILVEYLKRGTNIYSK